MAIFFSFLLKKEVIILVDKRTHTQLSHNVNNYQHAYMGESTNQNA